MDYSMNSQQEYNDIDEDGSYLDYSAIRNPATKCMNTLLDVVI